MKNTKIKQDGRENTPRKTMSKFFSIRVAIFISLCVILLVIPIMIVLLNQHASHQKRTNTLGITASGTQQVRRGVNLFGGWQGLYGGVETFASGADLDYFKSKGLNTFRVGFAWPLLQPTLNGPLNSQNLAMMDTLVANAKARGQQVAFVPLPGNYNGNDVGSSAVPVPAFLDLWTKLATHYKDETAIWGYDLLNEPGMGDIWNTSIAPQAIAAIRKVDIRHSIIVPTATGGYGYNWKYHTVGLPMQDSANNLIYETHFYFDWPPDGQYPNCNSSPYSCFDAYAQAAVNAGEISSTSQYLNIGVIEATNFVNWCKANGQRCYAGEYGVPGGWTSGIDTCTNGTAPYDTRWMTVLDNFLNYLDQNNIYGTYWAGGPYGDVNDIGPTCTGIDRPQMAILTKHPGINGITPTPIVSNVPTLTPFPANLMQNSSFESTGTNWLDPWGLQVFSGARGTVSQVSGTKVDGNYSAEINIAQSSTNSWYVQLLQGNIALSNQRTYTISFWAKASKNRAITITVQQNYAPYNQYFTNTVDITTSWQQYTLTFTPSQTDSNTLFSFNVAQATGNVWFDKVALQ